MLGWNAANSCGPVSCALANVLAIDRDSEAEFAGCSDAGFEIDGSRASSTVSALLACCWFPNPVEDPAVAPPKLLAVPPGTLLIAAVAGSTSVTLVIPAAVSGS